MVTMGLDGNYQWKNINFPPRGIAHLNMINQTEDGIIYATISDADNIGDDGIVRQNRYFLGINPDNGDAMLFFNFRYYREDSVFQISRYEVNDMPVFTFTSGPIPQELFYLPADTFIELRENNYDLTDLPTFDYPTDLLISGEPILRNLAIQLPVDTWGVDNLVLPSNEVRIYLATGNGIYIISNPQ